MKTKLLLAGMLCSMMSGLSVAQYYQSVPLTAAGFTDDVIANGAGLASVTTTNSIDDPSGTGANFAYYSKDFQGTTAPPYGLPVNGYLNSAVAATPWLPVQFQSYSGNNSLRMVAAGSTGMLTFATPTAATKVYVIGTSGSGSSSLNATVNFSDGTTQTATITLNDWFNGTNAVVQGVGRVGRTGNNYDGDSSNPRVYQSLISIDVANQSKTITSISFVKPLVDGYSNLFGISADKYSPCMAGTSVTAPAASLGTTSAVVNWTAPSTAPTSYDVYVTTTPVVPFDFAPATVSGISGTTLTLSSLTPNTVYYLWTRGSCGSMKGTWSYGTNFRTLCTTFTVGYTENFDTTATGSASATNAPACWNYLETSGFAGSGYVSASNSNSAPNSYILTNSSATTGSGMLVGPTTTNLSNGLNRVKFYAKGGGANYTLEVGTVSNTADASTFTAIGSPITLTTAHTLYTVNIPAGTNMNLAFRHGMGGTSRTIYIDDVSVEAIPACVEPIAPNLTSFTNNSASLSWTAGTPAPSGYQLYYSTSATAPTSSTVLNASNSMMATGTTATVSSLTPSSTYYVWVRGYCSATSQSTWVGPVNVYTGYCQVSTTNQNSWISSFTSTTASTNINYTSTAGGAGGYQNLTASQKIANTAGSTTPIALTAGGPTCGFAIWVDLNNNYTFETTERLFVTTGYVTSTTGNIVIPAGTPAGIYNARIVVNYNSTAPSDPCAVFTRGEYIDFAFQVTGSLATGETSALKNAVSVYPNPFSDVLNISDAKDLTSVLVYDMNGRLVKTIAKPEAKLHLGELNAGLYMITLKYKDGFTKTIKAVKK